MNHLCYVCDLIDFLTDQNLYSAPFAFGTPATSLLVHELGDNCIQIFHLGRYIVGYTVGNFCFTATR